MRQKRGLLFVMAIIVVIYVISNNTRMYATSTNISQNEIDFKVLCLNVHSTGKDFEERSSIIASIIYSEDPDFVFLTEYHDSCPSLLDNLLKQQYTYCQRGVRGYYALTECVYSKWRIDNISDIHIDTNTEKSKRYCTEFPAIENHIQHSAILRCEISNDDKKLVVYTCHLASNNYLSEVDSTKYRLPSIFNRVEQRILAYKQGKRLRELEAEEIIKLVQSDEYPVIVMGDMNDFPQSSTIKTFEYAGLKDTWRKGGKGIGSTFEDGKLKLRIDYILFSNGLKLQEANVLKSNVSDHKPITATFKIE